MAANTDNDGEFTRIFGPFPTSVASTPERRAVATEFERFSPCNTQAASPEQILARLAAMETYLVQIANSVSAIARSLSRECDPYRHTMPVPAVAPEPLPNVLAFAPEPTSASGLTEIFGPAFAPPSPAAASEGSGEATRIFTASAMEAIRAGMRYGHEGEFTKYFGRP
jgi:hypothetical protein